MVEKIRQLQSNALPFVTYKLSLPAISSFFPPHSKKPAKPDSDRVELTACIPYALNSNHLRKNYKDVLIAFTTMQN